VNTEAQVAARGSQQVDLREAHGVVYFAAPDRALNLLLCVLTGLSLMGTAWAIHESKRAQTRADIAELEVESFKNVLHSRGLPTAAHLPGESP
jgi:hypothetical protein